MKCHDKYMYSIFMLSKYCPYFVRVYISSQGVFSDGFEFNFSVNFVMITLLINLTRKLIDSLTVQSK